MAHTYRRLSHHVAVLNGMTPVRANDAKVLIVAPAWVGDMVMAHTLVRVLLESAPQGGVDMVAPPVTAPLASRMPGVGRAFTLEVGHGELGLRRRSALARRLAGEGYDQAIVLPNSFKSALLPWFARIPLRTGWTGEARIGVLNDRRRLDPATHPRMIDRFMALGLPPGAELPEADPLPQLRADPDAAEALAAARGLNPASVTALCPGAEFGAAKRWPAGHFAEVARREIAMGRQVWLFGSPGDVAAGAEIESLVSGSVTNLIGTTSLLEALDLLSLAERAVCNDSGLMHVAGALGVPVVAVYGSTSPDFTPPLGGRARIVRLGLDCSPCFERQCPLGHTNCLRQLMPEQVIEQL